MLRLVTPDELLTQIVWQIRDSQVTKVDRIIGVSLTVIVMFLENLEDLVTIVFAL